MKNMWKTFAAAAVALALFAPAGAQTIGGNASIAATTSSGNVALPASNTSYPYVLLEYGLTTTTNELFYKLGLDNTVAATTSSPALPANGVCLNVGPNQWIAAIAGASTGTLRITQLNLCPPK